MNFPSLSSGCEIAQFFVRHTACESTRSRCDICFVSLGPKTFPTVWSVFEPLRLGPTFCVQPFGEIRKMHVCQRVDECGRQVDDCGRRLVLNGEVRRTEPQVGRVSAGDCAMVRRPNRVLMPHQIEHARPTGGCCSVLRNRLDIDHRSDQRWRDFSPYLTICTSCARGRPMRARIALARNALQAIVEASARKGPS